MAVLATVAGEAAVCVMPPVAQPALSGWGLWYGFVSATITLLVCAFVGQITARAWHLAAWTAVGLATLVGVLVAVALW